MWCFGCSSYFLKFYYRSWVDSECLQTSWRLPCKVQQLWQSANGQSNHREVFSTAPSFTYSINGQHPPETTHNQGIQISSLRTHGTQVGFKSNSLSSLHILQSTLLFSWSKSVGCILDFSRATADFDISTIRQDFSLQLPLFFLFQRL